MIAFQQQIKCISQRLLARQEPQFQLSQDLMSIQGVAIAYIIDGAVVDLFIAITMCLFLWRRYLNIGNATKEYASRSLFPRCSNSNHHSKDAFYDLSAHTLLYQHGHLASHHSHNHCGHGMELIITYYHHIHHP